MGKPVAGEISIETRWVGLQLLENFVELTR